MPDTNLAKIVTLFVISRGCEYFRACQSCDLDRRQPDAACCRMNEDFLSPLDLPQMMQRIPSRHERHRNRRGLLEWDTPGLTHDKRLGNRQMRSEATRANGDYFVANLEALYLIAEGNNAPGTFVPEPQVKIAVHWINAEQLHYIAKIQSRRANLDLNFLCAGPTPWMFEQGQLVHNAGRWGFQTITGIAHRRGARGMRLERSPRDSARKPRFASPRDFRLAFARNDFPQ